MASSLLVGKGVQICSGGRYLIKVIAGALHIWCGDPGAALLTIPADQTVVGDDISEVYIEGDALGWIAKQKD
jgi:hypothetical protein